MPTITNPTHETLDVPALGRLLQAGETVDITDEEAEAFSGHTVLLLDDTTQQAINAAKDPAAVPAVAAAPEAPGATAAAEAEVEKAAADLAAAQAAPPVVPPTAPNPKVEA